MHSYGDGRTGMAAFCDTCGGQITEGDGYVVWMGDRPDDDWRVIHQNRCDPLDGEIARYDCSMPLGNEIIHLSVSAGIDLEEARENARVLDSM
jgi:hypothetical protein